MNDPSDFLSLIAQYDYQLPEELIAQEPAEPRDSAKLLVYNKETNKTDFDTFANLAKYLPEKAVLVFNQTKVLPARLLAKKPTGGTVELFYVKTIGDCIEVMANKLLVAGSTLEVENPHLTSPWSTRGRNDKTSSSIFKEGGGWVGDTPTFTVISKVDRYYHLKPSFPVEQIFSVLEQYGKTPIPPYIKHTPLSENELRQKYQTVFAKEKGSVAAPTASLHFTNELMEKIKAAGHDIKFVTLHVNLGTFAPLTETHVKENKLHEEWYSIDEETTAFLDKAKQAGRPIIAVGTTVVRTLESSSCHSRVGGDFSSPNVKGRIPDRVGDDKYYSSSGAKRSREVGGSQDQSSRQARTITKLSGATDLFIHEGYQFQFITGMITNFHVPKSSLLMLVAAFIGRKKLFELYDQAIERRFRFFSFGDGMLIY